MEVYYRNMRHLAVLLLMLGSCYGANEFVVKSVIAKEGWTATFEGNLAKDPNDGVRVKKGEKTVYQSHPADYDYNRTKYGGSWNDNGDFKFNIGDTIFSDAGQYTFQRILTDTIRASAELVVVHAPWLFVESEDPQNGNGKVNLTCELEVGARERSESSLLPHMTMKVDGIKVETEGPFHTDLSATEIRMTMNAEAALPCKETVRIECLAEKEDPLFESLSARNLALNVTGCAEGGQGNLRPSDVLLIFTLLPAFIKLFL